MILIHQLLTHFTLYILHILLTNTGSFGYVYRALWVPRANSTAMGSKIVAVKVMTRVAADALGRKYDDELTRAREEAIRVLEIAKRYRKPFLLLLFVQHFTLSLLFVLYAEVVKQWLTRLSKCMGLQRDHCLPKSPPSSRCSQEKKPLEW